MGFAYKEILRNNAIRFAPMNCAAYGICRTRAIGLRWSFGCDQTRKYRFWLVMVLATATIREGLAVNVGNSPVYEIEVTTAEMEYTNPEYVAEGAYFRSLRKSRNAPREIHAFYPFIKDLPVETEAAYVVYQKLSNRWVDSFIKGSVNVCMSLESKFRLYNFVYDKSNFPKKCPIKKGNYTMQLDTFNKVGLPPGLPRNEWKVKFKYIVKEEAIFIATFQTKLDTKKSQRGGHCWFPDPSFNLEKHVMATSCGGKGLERFVALHLSTALPDDKPPWELYVLDRCRRGNSEQVPVLLRVHPALGDGQALLQVLCNALADAALTSNGGPVLPPPSPPSPAVPPPPTPHPRVTISDSYPSPPTPSTPNGRLTQQAPAGNGNNIPANQQGRFQLYMQLARGAVFGPLSLLFWLVQSARGSSPNNHQPLVVLPPDPAKDSVCWSSSIALPKLRRIQQVSRSSLHCVLLSAVAGAARVLLQGYGLRHPADLRAVLPVSVARRALNMSASSGTKKNSQSGYHQLDLDNRTAPVVIALPTSVEGAVPRLWATRRCLQQLRSSADPAAVLVWSSAAASLWPCRRLAGKLLQTLTGVGSLQFAAMSGPTAPVVVGGATLGAVYSVLPPPDDVGLAVSVFTYAGQVYVTVAAERSLTNAGDILMTQINLQVELLWRLLRHRRAPGETRAQVSVRTAAASAPAASMVCEDVRSSPLRELASRLGVVQEELQRVRASHGDSARLMSLKAEFTQLLSEVRRRQRHRRRRRRRRTVSFSPAAPSPTPSPTPTPTPSPASDEDVDSCTDRSAGEDDFVRSTAKCRCVQPPALPRSSVPVMSAPPTLHSHKKSHHDDDYYTIADHYFPPSLKNPLKFEDDEPPPPGSNSPSPPPRLPSCLKNKNRRSRRRVTSTTSSDSSPSLSTSVLRQLKSYYDDAFFAAEAAHEDSVDLSSPSPPCGRKGRGERAPRRSPVPLWLPGAQNLKYADSDSDGETQPPIVVVDGEVQPTENLTSNGPFSPRHLSVTSIPRSSSSDRMRSPRHSSGDNGFYEGSEQAEDERQRLSSPESAINVTPSPNRQVSPFSGGSSPEAESTSPCVSSPKQLLRPSTLEVKTVFGNTCRHPS